MKKILFLTLCTVSQLIVSAQSGARYFPVNKFDSSYTDLQPLKELIGNKRIVMLGEESHRYGNVFTEKIRVMKFLHEQMGFDIIAFESGFYDLAKATEYIEAGQDVEGALNQALFFTWTSSVEFQPFISYVKSQQGQLQLVGFDSQFSGEYSADRLHDDIIQLKRPDQKDLFDSKLEYWETVVEHMAYEYDLPGDYNATIFKLIHSQLQSVISKDTNIKRRDLLLQTMKSILEMANDYHDNETSKKTELTFKAKDSNVRDLSMAENLIFWLKKHPKSKVICWGANGHFANSTKSLQNAELNEFIPMGQTVKKFAPDQLYTIFFTGISSTDTTRDACVEQELHQRSFFGIVDLKNTEQSFASKCLSANDSAFVGKWNTVLDAFYFVGDLIPKTDARLDKATIEPEEPEEKESKEPSKIIKEQDFEVTQSVALGVKITGKIIDGKTNLPIPYANLSVYKKGLGSSTNMNGEFVLKAGENMLNEPVRISYIGYQQKELTVKQLMDSPNLALDHADMQLSTVSIKAKGLTAKALMKKVIKAIENNYNQEAFTQTILTRNKMSNSGGRYYRIDCIGDHYDDNGFQETWMYMHGYVGHVIMKNARISKCDSLFNPVESYRGFDSSIALYGMGPWRSCNMLEMRHNNFLNKSLIRKYHYEISRIDSSNGELQYVVSFRCKRPTNRNTTMLAPIEFNGEIYINKSDLAITRITTSCIAERARIWMAENDPMYNSSEPWYVKESTTYKKQGKFYYFAESSYRANYDYLQNRDCYGLEITVGKREKSENRMLLPKSGFGYDPAVWVVVKD